MPWSQALQVAVLCAAVLLGACGGGGESPALADAATARATAAPPVPSEQPQPAAPPAVVPPYLRAVYVDGANARASDAGTGTQAMPYKTISAAMRDLRPGDDVIVAPGVYRESVIVPVLSWGSASTRLRAATARTVTVKGSVEASGWTQAAPGVYALSWSGEEPQQVFRAGQALRQIGGTVFGGFPLDPNHELATAHASEGGIWPGRIAGGAESLVPESFTYEAGNRRILVRTDTPIASDESLEVSARRHVLQAENASNLRVEGLDFAHANTSFTYRQGAVKLQGDHSELNNLIVQDMDGACVQLVGQDLALTQSTVQRCGQVGVTGRGQRLSITDNRILEGNLRGFNKWWEAGGIKLVGVDGLHDSVLRNNVVAYNQGDGIWIDWKNTQNLIEGNTLAYNSGFGLQYEASQSGTIRGNVAYGNGQRGIYLVESSDCVIQANAVFGNALEGIAIVDGSRSAADATLKPVGNRVLGNALAWNDFDRNWVQLVLPGRGFASTSDGNRFKAARIGPRMALGYPSSTNPAYERLAAWRTAAQADYSSSEETTTAPDAVQSALSARRLLQANELPAFLANPGVN